MYRIFFASRADKQLAKLARELKQKIYDELKILSKNPFSHPQVKKIKGTKFGYRLRVGRWRILFALSNLFTRYFSIAK